MTNEQSVEPQQKDPHIGEIHGIYTIVDVLDERDKYGHLVYVAKCNYCGFEKYSHYGGIGSPSAIKTTCKHVTRSGEYITMYKWKNRRLQKIFNGMKGRCYNPADKNYRWYGAKGIKVCDEWNRDPASFEKWALDNGYSDLLTIERKDEDGDYCPENCTWLPLEINSKYKSTTSIIDVDGVQHTGRDWSIELGFGVNLINTYIREYGEANTVEFIRRYLRDPRRPKKHKQSYYNLYMNCK